MPGEPVGAGAPVVRVREETPLPLEVAGPPPPSSSAMLAFSSSSSGEKALGCLSASSRAKRMALCVCREMRTAGWGSSVS
jgi:hypothetical protein